MLDVARQRQGHHPRRLGHLHRLRLHELERALRGRRRGGGQGLRQRATSTPGRHPQSGRQLPPRRPAADRHVRSQNQVAAGAYPLVPASRSTRRCRCAVPVPRRTLGCSHQLSTRHGRSAPTSVYSLGRDLNMRPRVNQRTPGWLPEPVRRLSRAIAADRRCNPNVTGNRPAVSAGEAHATKRRLLRLPPPPVEGRRVHGRLHAVAGASNIGVGVDQLNTASIQDPNDPWDAPMQFGSDGGHRRAASRSTFRVDSRCPNGGRVSPDLITGGRRCRWRSSTAATSTWTAMRRRFRRTAFAVDSFNGDTWRFITDQTDLHRVESIAAAACRSNS